MSKLLSDVRNKLRVHHYALKTEKTYVQWINSHIARVAGIVGWFHECSLVKLAPIQQCLA